MIIEIKAAFPIEWDREYYTVGKKKKEIRAVCPCCDDSGKVTIKGVEYICPKCNDNWRVKDVVGKTIVYYVEKWKLENIFVKSQGQVLTFRKKNSTSAGSDRIALDHNDLHDMVYRCYVEPVKFYDNYKAVMAEVKRLNAAERAI